MRKDAFKKDVIAPSPIPVEEGTAIRDCLDLSFYLIFFAFKK